MDRMDFTHAVARLRVMEKRLLDKNKVERLLDSNGAEEVLRILQETVYGEGINNIESAYEYEKVLKEELVNLYDSLNKISPVKDVIDIMSMRYDYHNIKVLIKAKALGKDLSNILIPIGTIPLDTLKNSISTGELKPLGKYVADAIKDIELKFGESKDPQVIDVLLDKYMFNSMLSKAKEMNIDYITRYVLESIDITNIKTMLRVKKQNKDGRFLEAVLIPNGTIKESLYLEGLNDSLENFIAKISRTEYSKVLSSILEEYSASGNISSLDALYDNYIMNHAKDAKRVNFGPEPIIAYIIAKETEIKIIRIIMVGKINNVSTEIIRERLRDLYV
ncbi:MAG: V-type ATP synthase subunit C [Clostridium sp.]|uniref:V-type ATP synthase subunit C n=1 Tax=Clostridium culturomicium TaxID=1499683 RepID=UPI00058BE313|nr:V-type ATP synthase subunit C [Clostridium culturomicium]MDU4891810.1 V-type ATP synthase subunit C [Clostridium sp.]MDU7084855.1 V-type ATP synthase subunit C [Clostridium sp.]